MGEEYSRMGEEHVKTGEEHCKTDGEFRKAGEEHGNQKESRETACGKNQTALVVIASSTGGPGALSRILPKLPESFPLPVVVVQHIWPGFTAGLSDSLKEKCSLPVSEAGDGERVLPGHIYLAPSEYHITIKKIPAGHHAFDLKKDETGGPRPKADILLQSLANSGYDRIIAVVLTGMGSDGTYGLLELSAKKNISLIVQDEASSVVYGMPGSARKAFENSTELPLDEIAEELINLSEGGRKWM